MSLLEIFGEPISIYTRLDAIRDGVLVELSRFFPWETRFYKYPVACTARVWETLKRDAPHKDIAARVSDLCEASTRTGILRRLDPSTVIFTVLIGGYRETLKAVCGPADDASPCITVMCQDED